MLWKVQLRGWGSALVPNNRYILTWCTYTFTNAYAQAHKFYVHHLSIFNWFKLVAPRSLLITHIVEPSIGLRVFSASWHYVFTIRYNKYSKICKLCSSFTIPLGRSQQGCFGCQLRVNLILNFILILQYFHNKFIMFYIILYHEVFYKC